MALQQLATVSGCCCVYDSAVPLSQLGAAFGHRIPACVSVGCVSAMALPQLGAISGCWTLVCVFVSAVALSAQLGATYGHWIPACISPWL